MANPGRRRSTGPFRPRYGQRNRAPSAPAHLAASTAPRRSAEPERDKGGDRVATAGHPTAGSARTSVAGGHGWALPSLVADPLPDPAGSRGGVSGTPTVLYEAIRVVARVTINRPARRNAMSWGVMGVSDGLAAAAPIPRSGSWSCRGGRRGLLCGGRPGRDGGGRRTRRRRAGGARGAGRAGRGVRRVAGAWASPPSPVSRAGRMAGGFGLALACDLVVASDRARFGAPEVNVGLWPYMITVPMVRSMPPKKALELMLTGRVVDATEADRLGFVTRVVPHGRARPGGEELAGHPRGQAPCRDEARPRRLLRCVGHGGPRRSCSSPCHAHPHRPRPKTQRKGIAAFLEKRSPRCRSTGGGD